MSGYIPLRHTMYPWHNIWSQYIATGDVLEVKDFKMVFKSPGHRRPHCSIQHTRRHWLHSAWRTSFVKVPWIFISQTWTQYYLLGAVKIASIAAQFAITLSKQNIYQNFLHLKRQLIFLNVSKRQDKIMRTHCLPGLNLAKIIFAQNVLY